MDLNTGEIEKPTLVKEIHTSNPVWDLWDIPIESIMRNRAQVEARKLIELQIIKKPQLPIPFPRRSSQFFTERSVLSKRA